MKPSRTTAVVLAACAAVLALFATAVQARPQLAAVASATCSDHPNQASAQGAKDTRDADGTASIASRCRARARPPAAEAATTTTESSLRAARSRAACSGSCSRGASTRTSAGTAAARSEGTGRCGSWVNRRGADERRDRLLEDIPTRDGFDRDEYPPAVGRSKGADLERGRNPRGWKADVRYVESSENRSHGASLGAKLRDFCNGTRFRYVFR